MPVTLKRWLIVRADGTMRVTTREPSLRWDEVSFKLNVRIPPSWGYEVGTIELTIPEGTVMVEPVEGIGLPPEEEEEGEEVEPIEPEDSIPIG